jgi:hypothetical protein
VRLRPEGIAAKCSHLQSFAVICSHLQSFAVICSHLQSLFAVICSHLQSLNAAASFIFLREIFLVVVLSSRHWRDDPGRVLARNQRHRVALAVG